jgi:uncharacterized protein YbjT (DUF2867 family)
MRILVTGASGFVGSLLIPRLLSDGHAIRALGRDRARVTEALALERAPENAAELEVVRGDALTGRGLTEALADIEVAYYLIHSMEGPRAGAPSPYPESPNVSAPRAFPPGSFAERDRIAADRFAAAAAAADVRRIVYLGGLLPRSRANSRSPRGAVGRAPVSRHLASREAVEGILLDAVPDSIALRASIIVGARSRSFRFLVHLVERMPVLTLPAWRRFHTRPIDGRDIIEMLAACATTATAGRSLDVGGPDTLTYGEMLARIAELMLVNRPALGLGVNLTPLTARIAAAIAQEDPELVVPLMEGLEGDLLPADDRAAELLNVDLHTFDSAVEHALCQWEESEPLRAR